MPSLLMAQDDCSQFRYKERVFDDIKVTTNIVYGQVDPYDGQFSNENSDLVDIALDFYEPLNDPIAIRPLVVAVYGGAFLFGEKEAPDVQAWCDSLARRGYACAAISYRLGLNPFNERSGVRAVYRAIQDLRAAIRFLEEDPNNMGFRVDPDNIFVEGQSAGAITAIHTAFIGEDERPLATFADPTALPDDRSDQGCLDCSGNNYQQPVRIKGILAMWGALETLAFAEPEDKLSILMVHGDLDEIVPFNSDRPFNSPFFPIVHGSNIMKDRFAQLGFYHEFYPYQNDASHTVYGSGDDFPNANWFDIFDNSQRFLHGEIAFNSPVPSGQTTVDTVSNYTYTVPVSDNPYCWTVTGGTILQNRNNGNEVVIKWDNVAVRNVQVRETNYFGLKGEPGVLNIATDADALPLVQANLQADVTTAHIRLSWDLEGLDQYAQLQVERSKDGRFFHALDTESMQITGTEGSLVDANPLDGANFYRLELLDELGTVYHSRIVESNWVSSDLTVFLSAPNTMTIQLAEEDERGTLQLMDTQGKVLLQQNITAQQTNSSLPNLTTGVYLVQVRTATGLWTKKLFVK